MTFIEFALKEIKVDSNSSILPHGGLFLLENLTSVTKYFYLLTLSLEK